MLSIVDVLRGIFSSFCLLTTRDCEIVVDKLHPFVDIPRFNHVSEHVEGAQTSHRLTRVFTLVCSNINKHPTRKTTQERYFYAGDIVWV